MSDVAGIWRVGGAPAPLGYWQTPPRRPAPLARHVGVRDRVSSCPFAPPPSGGPDARLDAGAPGAPARFGTVLRRRNRPVLGPFAVSRPSGGSDVDAVVDLEAVGDGRRVRLRVAGEGFDQIVRVSVPGDPRLAPGTPVAVEGLALVTWERPGGCGYALRAHTITPCPDAAPRERP